MAFSSRPYAQRRDSVTLWLLICCAMVFVMAIVGAITRLTGSGLSITEWKPIMGVIPPTDAAGWERAFAAYKQIPQYKIFNQGIDLDAFKWLYFWEWFHRLWGRLIGVVVLLPLLIFWRKGMIDRALAKRLGAIFLLGGLQGFIGWFMVQSGLDVRTTVSPYRLALHLSCALVIYSALVWTVLDRVRDNYGDVALRHLSRHGFFVLFFLSITIIWGAFVAGLRAGEAYNTWPLMEGDILPAAAWTLMPQWLNVFENLALVQFTHRWIASVTMLLILVWVMRAVRNGVDGAGKRWFVALGIMALLQVGLGIVTLLTHVNIVLATLHQAGAMVLLTLVLVNLHCAMCAKVKD